MSGGRNRGSRQGADLYSVGYVARMLDVSVGTVRAKMHRLRESGSSEILLISNNEIVSTPRGAVEVAATLQRRDETP